YEADFPCGAPQRLKRLRKKSRCGPQRPSAAKAGIQNNVVIAALKRCATQNREQDRVFQQPTDLPPFSAHGIIRRFGLGRFLTYPPPELWESGKRVLQRFPSLPFFGKRLFH